MNGYAFSLRTVFSALTAALFLLLALPAHGQQAQTARGLWLLPRKDTGNTARADVPGRMKTAPKEVWRYGGDRSTFGYIAPVTVAGREAYLTQVRSGLRLLQPDGTVVWDHPKQGVGSVIAVEDFDGDGTGEALAILGQATVALIDVPTGVVRWSWDAPTGASVGSYQIWRNGKERHLICFPMNALRGVCLDLTGKGGAAPIVWDRAYPDTYWQGYGPQIVLADMDRDGVKDIVLCGKPGYTAVIDSGTGAIRCECRHDITGGDHAGRPYGLLTVADLDGDKFPDIVMLSCQVEEYAMVVRNEQGKGLKAVWSQFLEHDLPDDFRELRPNLTSIEVRSFSWTVF